jgi:UDP-galactopyranose mutase
VYFVEEPVFDEVGSRAWLEVRDRGGRLWVATPHLPHGLSVPEIEAAQRLLLDELFAGHGINDFALWYYTPMALTFTRHLNPAVVVYDCMDELSAFAGAPLALRERESELFARADVVFTGGHSLYESKRDRHPNVHAFPSSIEVAHFAKGREQVADPEDQAPLGRPRLGFFGVIDERFDRELLGAAAAARPDWQFIMIGPVVKIDPASLPQLPNIHYLGGKKYAELPTYLAGWDVALMPFARNESTRFISPTKTPEYLAAGRPVVSTSIRDVVRPYGQLGLVEIADSADEFVAACERTLATKDRAEWLKRVDTFLATTSWDRTWESMSRLLGAAVAAGSDRAKATAGRGLGFASGD